jgi:heat shock protein HslJ
VSAIAAARAAETDAGAIETAEPFGVDVSTVELSRPLTDLLPADLDAWLRFEGRAVWGRGGCNRFTGGFELGGELFTIGPVAATMMACPGALMAAERGLFAALEATRTFDIEADGTLVLIGPAGPVARLVP